MKKQLGDQSGVAGLFFLASLGMGLLSLWGAVGPRFSPDLSGQILQAVGRSPNQTISLSESDAIYTQVNGESPCRRILGDGYALYTDPNPDSAEIRILSRGQRVGLPSGTNAVRGTDGNLYIMVSSPYNSARADTGYMLAQARMRPGGGLEPTLGLCRTQTPPPSGPVNGYW